MDGRPGGCQASYPIPCLGGLDSFKAEHLEPPSGLPRGIQGSVALNRKKAVYLIIPVFETQLCCFHIHFSCFSISALSVLYCLMLDFICDDLLAGVSATSDGKLCHGKHRLIRDGT